MYIVQVAGLLCVARFAWRCGRSKRRAVFSLEAPPILSWWDVNLSVLQSDVAGMLQNLKLHLAQRVQAQNCLLHHATNLMKSRTSTHFECVIVHVYVPCISVFSRVVDAQSMHVCVFMHACMYACMCRFYKLVFMVYLLYLYIYLYM